MQTNGRENTVTKRHRVCGTIITLQVLTKETKKKKVKTTCSLFLTLKTSHFFFLHHLGLWLDFNV